MPLNDIEYGGELVTVHHPLVRDSPNSGPVIQMWRVRPAGRTMLHSPQYLPIH